MGPGKGVMGVVYLVEGELNALNKVEGNSVLESTATQR
jgi:hypothetical protein